MLDNNSFNIILPFFMTDKIYELFINRWEPHSLIYYAEYI